MSHATVRCQQRCISQLIQDLLLEFGARQFDGHGAEIVFFDLRARKRVINHSGGAIGKNSRELSAYLVLGSNGDVLTVGHRFRRINRN